MLDPGHNGGNGKNTKAINALIPDGRGGKKACNTVGTSTNSGYAEHAFTWDVANRVAVALRARGATVVLTRDLDTGVGPCVDARGKKAGEVKATALVSIHANGSTNRTVRGFFAITAKPAIGKNGPASEALANSMVTALKKGGYPPNTKFPTGKTTRADLATLNFAQTPAVMLELGEMRNPIEGAVMSTAQGRQNYANAIVAGLVDWTS